MLTYYQRKERLPWGAQKAVAAEAGCSEAYISMVMKGIKRDRAVERGLAALMRPVTGVAVAFGPPKPVKNSRAERATP